jgi:hypothetical protein
VDRAAAAPYTTPMLAALLLSCLLQDVPGQDPELVKMLAAISPERIEKTIRTLAGFKTRHTLSRTDSDTEGIGAARNWIEQEMKAAASQGNGRMKVERKSYRQLATRLRQEVELVDLVATLPGTSEPARVYVVSGHYDSINGSGRNNTDPAPGANDDGSGTALSLELCRVMAGHEFAATILFVAADGEEHGLLGATGLAKELAASNTNVDGMLTADIIGNTVGVDGRRERGYVRCFSYAARGNDTTGRALARAAADAARRYVDGFAVKLIFRGDRYGRGGDHAPFMREGFPAIRFTEAYEDWSRQHQFITEKDGKPYADLPEFVDFEYVARVTRVAGALVGTLARAPEPPLRVEARGLTKAYDTELKVTPGKGARPWGLEVVWRATTSPDWEGSKLFPLAADGGGQETLRVPGVLLDDSVVGVRTVSAGGHRSRVVTPPEPDATEQRPASSASQPARGEQERRRR